MKKILILNHQGIGDIVVSLPIYYSIRSAYPDAEIHSTVKTLTEKILLESQSLSDKFILSDYHKMNFIGKIAWLFKMSFKRFDVIIAPVSSNVRYAIIIRIISLSKRLITAYNDVYFSLFISDTVRAHSRAKRVYNNQLIADLFYDKPAYPLPMLKTTMNNEEVLGKFDISEDANIIGIHPGCGELDKWKRWLPSYYSELINMINDSHEFYFILFGVKNEVELCNEIIDGLNVNNNVHMLCGLTTIEESLSLISSCNLFLSADSGLMHLASALNIKTYSIFGPSPHMEIAPYQNDATIINQNFSCSPCWPDLPEGCGSPDCMKGITPDMVYSTMESGIRDILKKV